MKRPANRLSAAFLAMMVAGAGSGVTAAAESAAGTQDLVNVRTAGQVTATWTRQSDFYALQVVLDPSRPRSPGASTPARQPVSRVPGPASPDAAGAVSPDRTSFFIGNTIANLRGMDPAFGCRTLTLVDGRRIAGGQPSGGGQRPAASAPPAPLIQSYPPAIKHSRLDVWLLKADGTQLLPAAYICVPPSGSQSRSDEVTYRYSIADSAQAVAAAIRIDGDFYIEKLRPLESGQ